MLKINLLHFAELLIGRCELPPSNPMPMSVWYATEGGRKCPTCGRCAKSAELGWVGFCGPNVIVDAYGHLPGFGCNGRVTAGAAE